MRLQDLVGKVIIRRAVTTRGGELCLNEPCLLLSLNNSKAILCALEDSQDYVAGKTITLGLEYFDNEWVEYGPLINSANVVRAQLVRKILDIMGIQADEDSILTLCRAITIKQIYDELNEQLSLNSIIYALNPSSSLIKDESEQEVNADEPISLFDDEDDSSASGAAQPQPVDTPALQPRGFIRRG